MMEAEGLADEELRNENPYEVGQTVRWIDPAKIHYRFMLYLVAYDIRNPRRLRRVAKVCEDYGVRVEYSVFECDLPEEVFQRMWRDLAREIDAKEDALLAYRICGACVERIESMGVVPRPQKTLLYMI
ncbi:MAG TPA: CRISPR-associated endonuclease Cas2 [Acidobacteriota bacterium]|nr:CRISPR-associated endonuclease Cas2 [Acidobacteriota bacterium]HRR26792.1 CRISPR-associated endonuclease Cas2 [Acidobacteriota bacterium]HRR56606.1 CRISPR-associated endonuclease Cas2 [Acidobacteriota bacterium]HRV07275.1 CRISPR-associated endonuclease Cas2 [Acidobacteriota bacterium]